MQCKKCDKPFESPEFANDKMTKFLRLASPFCTECRAIIRTERESVARDERQLAVQIQQTKWLGVSGIPPKYIRSTFQDFDKVNYGNAYETAKAYAESFDYGNMRGKPSIYLYSSTLGVGKTYLATSIAHAIIDNWDGGDWSGEYDVACPVLFISEHDFLLRVRASFNHRYQEKAETEDEIYKMMIGIPLLILDDIGKEETDKRDDDSTSSKFVRRAYWEVIDGRYQADLPMVITANYGTRNIKNFLGAPSTERIIEMCSGRGNIIELVGLSKRFKTMDDVSHA